MDKRNTKQRILDAALDLFSVKGFDGVSIKEIAAQVGIKDSSLYKHFPSKQAMFDTLLQEMDSRFGETVALYKLPQGEIKKIAREYGGHDLTWLKKACEAVFLFFLKDPKASRFRRLMMIEQYKNNAAAEAFQGWFVDAAVHFQTELFSEMIKQGYFKKGPAKTMALQFYAPFYLLLFKYDTMPEKTDEALGILMDHITQFAAVYHAGPDKKEKK